MTEIERLPMVELKTRTLTEKEPTVFQGVLLRDILNATGLQDIDSVTIRAEDEYSAVIPRSDWDDYPLLFATRVEGKPLGIRQFGPARLIYPSDTFPELSSQIHNYRAVWMIRSIEK